MTAAGLARAVAEVDERQPPPLNLTDHPQALKALGEFLDEREAGEQATPAA